MIDIPLGDGEGAVSKLPLNDPDVDLPVGEETSTGVPEPMYVYSPGYATDYRVASGEFTHIATVYDVAPVTGEEESFTVVGPYGHPVIKLPRRFPVNPNHPTLTALTLEYSDGTTFRVYVANAERKNLTAPQLTAEGKQEHQPVPFPRD